MSQKMPSPQSEEQPSQKKDSQKKLQKREQRILERLQEAQAAQAKALERFHRAEARLQKRMQRLQRMEARLTHIRQQLGEPQEAPAPPAQDIATTDTTKEGDSAAELAGVGQQSSAPGMGAPVAAPSQEERDDARPVPPVDEMLQEPFAAAVFMEEILLVDAAEHVTLPPAYTGDTGKQPAEEVEAATPQAFSVKPAHRVQEARAAAEAAEENARRAAERATEVAVRIEQMGSGRHLMRELLQIQAEADRASTIAQEAERAAEEVEQEEEMVEALAAKSIAEIAAERAASAEAIAEASSVQTREARRRVQEAEAALGQVRLAIRNGTLSDAEAGIALQNAENELTRASAFLADAEATEEQALNNAMNAEAEAEVAEGMAHAAEERELEDPRESPSDISTTENEQVDDDELDATLKIRIVHPPEPL